MKLDPHRFDDLFAEIGPVTLRRMFGGEGLSAGGVFFGFAVGERIFLKTDETTRPAFAAEQCEAFAFNKGGKRMETALHAIPDRLYDDPEELAAWVRRALATVKTRKLRSKAKSLKG